MQSAFALSDTHTDKETSYLGCFSGSEYNLCYAWEYSLDKLILKAASFGDSRRIKDYIPRTWEETFFRKPGVWSRQNTQGQEIRLSNFRWRFIICTRRWNIFSEKCFMLLCKAQEVFCHFSLCDYGARNMIPCFPPPRSQFGNHQCKSTSAYNQHLQGDRELSYLPRFWEPIYGIHNTSTCASS